METALLIANLLNAAAPNIAENLLLIRKSDGSVAVVRCSTGGFEIHAKHATATTSWRT